MFVYMGSTRCSICLDGPNKDFFKSINNNISSAAIESNFSVKRIGISVGSELNEGFNFLSQFDVNFDEIIVSPDNFNTGMIKYLYNDFKGEPTVPQFIILKRTYNQDISGIETVNRSIEDEKLLYRLVGLPNIEKFSKNSELINYSNFFD